MEIGEDGVVGQLAQGLVAGAKGKNTGFAMTQHPSMAERNVLEDQLSGMALRGFSFM
jgi:hypothetical protein